MIIICESNKPGLNEHLEAIKSFNLKGKITTISRYDYSYPSWLFRSLISILINRGPIIFFSIGCFSIILATLCRIRRKLCLYFCHEPGNITYYYLRHNFFKSFALFFFNFVLSFISNKVIIANPYLRFIYGRKILFCPLPSKFHEMKFTSCPTFEYNVGILGTLSNERGLSEIDLVSKSYTIAALSNSKLPHKFQNSIAVIKDSNYSTLEKDAFLRSVASVVNLRWQPFNQSGVTVDCLIRGVPILTTNFDLYVNKFFFDLLPQLNPFEISNDSILKNLDFIINLSIEKRAQIQKRGINLFYFYPENFFQRIENFSHVRNYY